MNAVSSSRAADRCRICGSRELSTYLDMGRMPLANAYLRAQDLDQSEFAEELALQLCRDCGLSQLTKVVPPDRMFRNYLYVSSTTATIREHFSELAATAARAVAAAAGDGAFDIASNDGCLLKSLRAAGLVPVGIDPAENLAAEANAAGLTTECAYWSLEVAERLARRQGRPKIITAANVFAHADDLQSFMAGVAAVLAPRGLFIIECPYVVDFIARREFDTAYHEHLSYLGITPLARLMESFGFRVVDVEYFSEIHGGTIRVFCGRAREWEPKGAVERFLRKEESFGIKDLRVYQDFAGEVLANRERLRALVLQLRAAGKVLWAYGASAKGNTLMNFFGLKADQVPVVIDDNPKKWGLHAPGSHMRIDGIGALRQAPVACLLLLAWNFEAEIRGRCRAAGYEGDFLVPVPQARLIPGAASKGDIRS